MEKIRYNILRDQTINDIRCGKSGWLWMHCSGIANSQTIFSHAERTVQSFGKSFEQHGWKFEISVLGRSIRSDKGYGKVILSSPLFQFLGINGLYLKAVWMRTVWKCLRRIRLGGPPVKTSTSLGLS